MKSAISIFLFLVFTFNIGGPYAILKLQEYQIKKEIIQQIREGISNEGLTTITITSENQNQLIWKDSKEFSYRGKMYDVVKAETRGKNTKVYQCISDVQETKLIANYNKELQKNQKKNNRNDSVKTIKFLRIIELLPQKENVAFQQKEQSTNFYYHNDYSPLSLDISSPPPKQII